MYMSDPILHMTVHHLLPESPLVRKLHYCILFIGVFFFFMLSICLIIRVWSLWFINCLVYNLLQLSLLWHLLFPLTAEHWDYSVALLHLLVATELMGIPTWSLAILALCRQLYHLRCVLLPSIWQLLLWQIACMPKNIIISSWHHSLGSPLYLFNAMTLSLSWANQQHHSTKDDCLLQTFHAHCSLEHCIPCLWFF